MFFPKPMLFPSPSVISKHKGSSKPGSTIRFSNQKLLINVRKIWCKISSNISNSSSILNVLIFDSKNVMGKSDAYQYLCVSGMPVYEWKHP